MLGGESVNGPNHVRRPRQQSWINRRQIQWRQGRLRRRRLTRRLLKRRQRHHRRDREGRDDGYNSQLLGHSQNVIRRPTWPVRVDATLVICPNVGDVTVVFGLLSCRQLNTLNDSKRT
jgi:hypothetical protein